MGTEVLPSYCIPTALFFFVIIHHKLVCLFFVYHFKYRTMLSPLVSELKQPRGINLVSDPAWPEKDGREIGQRAQKGTKIRHVPVEMKTGMKQLLELHNDEELRILCGMLGMREKRTKSTQVAKIFALHLQRGENSYKYVLSLIWEGIIIDYLRTVGKKVRSHTQDPRQYAMTWWKRAEEIEGEGFSRVYVPQTAGLREEETTDDIQIVSFLNQIRAKEKKIKAAENNIRRNASYEGAMNLLKGMVEVRGIESELRKELIRDLEKTRSQMFLSHVREAGERFKVRNYRGMYEELKEKYAIDLSNQEMELQVFYDIANIESAENTLMKIEYDNMLQVSIKQQWKTDKMRQGMENSRMRMEMMAAKNSTMRKEINNSISEEKRTGGLLRDLQGVFGEYVQRKQWQTAVAKSVSNFFINMATGAEEFRIRYGEATLETRNEEYERMEMTYEEMSQRRTAQLRPSSKKGKKGGGKKGGGKKGGKKGEKTGSADKKSRGGKKKKGKGKKKKKK